MPRRGRRVKDAFASLLLTRVWAGSQVSTRLLPAAVQPLSAHVKLTENCQAKCISCDYWKSRWHDQIDTDRAVKLVNEIRAAGIRSMRFTEENPASEGPVPNSVEGGSLGLKRIVVQSNGLLLKKLHEEINASPITNISVSIDGLKESMPTSAASADISISPWKASKCSAIRRLQSP